MSKPIIGIGSDVAVKPGQRDRAFVYTTYIESLKRAGAIPLLVPPQPENAAEILDGLDGLVLAGGDDCDPAVYGEERHPSVEPMDPRRQNNELALARLARERGIPTLGICLGVQVMNVAAGGTLIQDIDSAMQTDIEHASDSNDRHRHGVQIDSGTRLGRILGGAGDAITMPADGPQPPSRSTLHLATAKVLETAGSDPVPARQIANEVAVRGLYVRQDGTRADYKGMTRALTSTAPRPPAEGDRKLRTD